MNISLADHIRKEAIMNGIGNCLFNGLFAWLLLGNKEKVYFFAKDGIAVDITLTSAILLFIVAIIVISIHRKKIETGRLDTIDKSELTEIYSCLNSFPGSLFGQAACFALIGLTLVAPLTLLGFWLSGVDSLSVKSYVAFKSAWTGLIAFLLVKPMILVSIKQGKCS